MISRTLQDLFVDRLIQLDRFRQSLRGASGRRIIVVTAPEGMGKSWLLRQFANEAQELDARSVLIDFSDGQAYDALALVRRFRDALDSAHFNPLTQAINDTTVPRLSIDNGPGERSSASISLGSGSEIGDVSIGDVAGGNILKDNLFIVQTDNPLALQALEDRITSVFFTCLAALSQETKIVFLFDSYERNSLESDRWAPNTTDRWITSQLLTRIREGRLANVLVVLAGNQVPDFGIEWNAVLGRLPLEPFTPDDVTQYLRENRGLTLGDTEIQTLYTAIQGNPQLLGILGDNLEQATRPSVADDEW
ncbi:MAG: ATP-binding protein [Chloroflexales bacterium]|nr:ATP-binding protein [Chloroflexales bacterium]